MEGRVFARLRVLIRGPNYKTQRTWVCQCECGAEVVARTGHLTSGAVKSCGCLRAERRFKHGGAYRSEYNIWRGMRQRCSNPKQPEFHNYGGRGIRVCEEWETSFAAFLRDMGPRPSPEYEVDRKDTNGPYNPANCRWATRAEQCRNMRKNVLLTHAGETLCVTEWSRRSGVNLSTLRSRLRAGWPLDAAFRP